MQVNIQVEDYVVNELIISAIEDSIGDWEMGVKLFDNENKRTFKLTPQPLEDLSCIVITAMIEGEESDYMLVFGREFQGKMVRDKSQAIAALECMASKCPIHFQNIVGGSYDSETADVFVQCWIFGARVFS